MLSWYGIHYHYSLLPQTYKWQSIHLKLSVRHIRYVTDVYATWLAPVQRQRCC